MAGAFSGHLLNSHNSIANTSFNSPIVTSGAMSFNPMMHGTPYPQQPFNSFYQAFFNPNDSISEETAKKIATLQVKLNQKLGPEYISQRPGPGGGPKLTYVEGWKVINLANEVFGFNGWNSSIISITTDFTDYNEETRRYSVGITAVVRVTLRDGVYHEDIGYGLLENSKSKGAALDKCKKEAVTDALKRALRHFGNVMGNCLYDKSYASEIVKVKFEPPKFNKDELHRRPEFEDAKSNIALSNATAGSSKQSHNNNNFNNRNATETPTRSSMQNSNQAKPATSLPAHMRTKVANTPVMSTSNHAQNRSNNKGRTPMYPQRPVTGLNTPITTPAHQQLQRFNFTGEQLQQTAQSAAAIEPKQAGQQPPMVKSEDTLNGDDSFGLNSEDDAFLATVDLGPPIANDHEADIGRPIESDLDIGRPIAHDEGSNLSVDDSSIFGVHPSARINPGLRSRTPSTSRNDPSGARSRQEIMEAALRGENVESSTSGLKQAADQQRQAQSILKSSTAVASLNSGIMQPTSIPQKARTVPTPIAQAQHQRHMQKQVNQGRNQSQNQNVNPVTGKQMQRAPTPVGGFNFPPGMNPLNKDNNAPSGVGIKRPHDPNASNYRGGRPGMGLQQATASINHTGSSNRQPLGSLDIGDGGDIKRPRLA